MEALCSTDIFLFEGFRLDRRGLFRRCEDAALAPVEIGSRALEVLRVLLRRPGELLLRHEIMAAAWPSTVVGDNNLNVQISALRRVLDQDCASGSCIQTIPGCGYRFVAPVKWLEANPHSHSDNFPRRRAFAAPTVDRRAAVRQCRRRSRGTF